MIAFARQPSRPQRARPVPSAKIVLSEPEETLIIPWHTDRIDAEIGENDQIKRLIVYVKRPPRRMRRRWIARFWR